MFYAVRHFTQFRYSRPVRQSVMEVRMQPRSENTQRCFTFQLSVSPRARIFSYTDHLGNLIHHFDIPASHQHLTIVADTLVDVEPIQEMPDTLGEGAWEQLDQLISEEDYWDMLMPSHFARSSPELEAFEKTRGASSRNGRDPLVLLRDLTAGIYDSIAYVRDSTRVDSPIEDALRAREGVCQDLAHIMIAMVRNLRIPCRYVSGYLHHGAEDDDRSADSATHAWVEALLPRLGWVGFDPTNNVLAGPRHIRTAIGRDYADVPPTVGTLKGKAGSAMQVKVRVTPSEAVLPPDQEFAADEEWSRFLETRQDDDDWYAHQQQ